MSRLAWISVGAAVAVGACAYPNFVFDGSTGGQGGSGPTTTTTTTVSSTTSGTGGSAPACKVTHPGGGTCEYLPGEECGCSKPEKCTVIDPKTGESQCLSAGTTPDYGACSSTTDCADGSWCELSTSVCEPICSSTCTGGTCVHAAQATTGTATIPGLDVCSASCDLVSASPCGAGATCVNLTDSNGDTVGSECIMSAMIPLGMPCALASDCAAGMVCTEDLTDDNTECSLWCSADEDPCPDNGLSCKYFEDPSVDLDGHDYGYCG
jgi:hypothetical protein